GAEILTGGQTGGGTGGSYRNTLLRVTVARFVAGSKARQTEAFGNCSLIVVARDADQLVELLDALEGNLTGAIYSAQDGRDDALYERIAPGLLPRGGRL